MRRWSASGYSPVPATSGPCGLSWDGASGLPLTRSRATIRSQGPDIPVAMATEVSAMGGSRLERPNRPRSDGCDDLGFRPTFGATAQDRVGDQLPMTGSNCILTTPMIVRLLILR